MRTNGFDFHQQLANGEVSWEDDRVKQTFANWKQLIDMGAFIDNHQTYSWQEVLPFMVQGDAAAYLMGNFAVAPLREAGLTDDQLDFYQFVAINPDVELAEDAPTDTFHIPANASNKEAAREFLRFVVSADEQTEINNGKNLGQLPVNAKSSVDDDKFLQEGFKMLSSNSPGGVAQFWDRDAPAEKAKVSMEGFQEFMVKPDNLTDIPPQLVVLMRSQINVQELTVRALVEEKPEHIYHAAMMDPHTAAELDLRQIRSLVSDLLTAHADWLPDWCCPARAA